MKSLLLSLLLLATFDIYAQRPAYTDSLKKYQQDYVKDHEVVKEADKKYFNFFPVNRKYRVVATFKKIDDAKGFIMKTSGTKPKKYFKYGILSFTLNKKPLKLTVYQSEQLMKEDEYKDHLFVPFTDLTSGEESYAGGKYLDFVIQDIKNDKLLVDFNKAYNPYCAYSAGYNCPIPPRENDLPVAVKAGEKDFGKSH